MDREQEPVSPVEGEDPQQQVVAAGDGGGDPVDQARALGRRKGARGTERRLLSAALLAGAGFWLAVHVAGAGGAGPEKILASPAFFLGVTFSLGASIWAAWLLEMERAGRGGRLFLIVIVPAILFRLLAVAAPPALSDDIYRYLWDGHVQREGINPYAHAPGDPALDPLETPYRERINHSRLPTIYPPLSQIFFLAAASLPGGIPALKLLLILFDLGTILILAEILRRRGQAPARVVIYAWSPLAVIEIGWSGHVDPVGVFFLMAACLAFEGGRPRLGWIAGALSGAAKYAGWLGVVPFARGRRLRSILWLPATALLAYLPYAGAGTGVTGSLLTYAEHWRFNDSLFGVIARLAEWSKLGVLARGILAGTGLLDPSATWESSILLHLVQPLAIARMIAAACFVLFAIRILTRGWEDPIRESFALLAGALILSPTLHPWYLLWIAPFMAIVPRISWIWLCGAVLLFSYPDLITRSGAAQPMRWLAWLQYTPFFVILLVESARRRLWERD